MATSQDFVNYVCGPCLSPQYLVHCLLFTDWQPLKAGSTHSTIYMSIFERMRIVLPPLEEQHRIVIILNTLDAAIRTYDALIAAKEKYKAAYAERLLTGRERFPGFEGQPWREVRLGDVLTEVERPVDWSDSTLYTLLSVRRRAGGLFTRGKLHGHEIKTKTLKTAHTGDFVISRMQVVHGAWGLVTPEFSTLR